MRSTGGARTARQRTAFFLVVLSFNLAGDWLRDALDPRRRGRNGAGYRLNSPAYAKSAG